MPLLVTVLTAAPTKLPCRTSNGAMFTCTASMASIEIGATPVRSPGWPERPNELLKYDPSTVMLFIRLSIPANEDPLAWGVRRVKSSMRREMVGSFSSASRDTVVAAPVRVVLNSPPTAVTVTPVRVVATDPILISTSVETPRVTVRSSLDWRANPMRAASTV